MKAKEDFLKGCEHDGSYIPVNEVKRLMDEYAKYYHNQKLAEMMPGIKEFMRNYIEEFKRPINPYEGGIVGWAYKYFKSLLTKEDE